MLRQFARTTLEILLAIAVLGIIALAGISARLAAGPIDLSFLTTTIEHAAERAVPSLAVDIGRIELNWARWHGGPHLLLASVRLSNGIAAPFAVVDEIRAWLRTKTLIRGNVAIDSLEASGAEIHVTRQPDGRFVLFVPSGDASQPVTVDGLVATLSEGDPSSSSASVPSPDLRNVTLENARLVIAETNSQTPSLTIDIPGARLQKHFGQRTFEADLSASDTEATPPGAIARLHVEGSQDANTRSTAISVTADGLRPATFSGLAREVAPLAVLDLPISGTTHAVVGDDGTIDSLDVLLSAAQGHLRITPELAKRLGSPAAPLDLEVRTLQLTAQRSTAEAPLDIAIRELRFAPGTKLTVPAPLDHAFPLSALSLKATLQGEKLQISALDLNLDGPTLSATGNLADWTSHPAFDAHVEVHNVPVDRVRTYWPKALAPGGQSWTVEHLSNGTVSVFSIDLAMAADPKDPSSFDLKSMSGYALGSGITVNYLPPLPPVHDASTRVDLNLDRVVFNIGGGQSDGVGVRSGIIVIDDFDAPVERIDIDLNVGGELVGALRLLSHPPLEFTDAIGVPIDKTSGTFEGSVRLRFPLLNDLKTEQIDVSAQADLKSITIADVVPGVSVDHGRLSLSVAQTGMHVSGPVTVAGFDGLLDWQETFNTAAGDRTQMLFVANDVKAAQVRRKLRDFGFVQDLLDDGTISLRVSLDEENGTGALSAELDLSQARCGFEPIGWSKARNVPAIASLDLILDNGVAREIRLFSLVAETLDLKGHATFASDGSLDTITVDHFFHGNTDMSATIVLLEDGGLDVHVTGASVDIQPAWNAMRDSEDNTNASTNEDFLPKASFSLVVDVDRLWIGRDRMVTNVEGTFVREGKTWDLMQADAVLPSGGTLRTEMHRDNALQRTLVIEAADAGAALRLIGAFDDMRDGKLRLEGILDDSDPRHPLKGALRVRNYRIVNAPFLARLLNVLALSGIADALRGGGISFATLDAPFTFDGEILTLSNVQAYGAALGLTASGQVNAANETIDVNGTVVPFYILNSALGRLPVIGPLFSGGEKGGGLFAAIFAMKGSLNDPEVTINPLTVLVPSFLRYVFSLFDTSVLDLDISDQSQPALPATP